MDMGAVEAGGVGKRHRHILGHATFLLGVLDESGQVVADNFRHAGGEDRDHLRFVDGVGVFQPLMQVVLATEHRAVLGHRVGHGRSRLTEMTVEGGAVVGSAALGTMHEGERPFKTMGGQLGAQRLTSMNRVDHQRLTGKVFLFILFGIDPFLNPFHLFGRGLDYFFDFKS